MLLALALLACRTEPCPRGWSRDERRVERLAALAGRSVDARVCFGPVEELGVRDDRGRLLLDAGTADALLAARVVHLGLHAGPAPRGPGCRDALLREEARAWREELVVRTRLGVADPTCPVVAALGAAPAVEDIARWLAQADHPRATDLRASHDRRCTE